MLFQKTSETHEENLEPAENPLKIKVFVKSLMTNENVDSRNAVESPKIVSLNCILA